MDYDRQHEDGSLTSDEVSDGEEIQPEDEQNVRLEETRARTNTEAKTTAIQSMIKAIVLAIGECPDDQTVPEEVRKGMESFLDNRTQHAY